LADEKKPQGIKRSDPDPRPVEGALNRVAVTGQDPDKHYVWVSEVNDPTMNPGSYRAMGYRFTQFDPGEEQPVLGYNPDVKQGDHIKAFGCVLMECSKEQKAKIDAEGAPGMGGGQRWADRVCESIKRRDIIDETEPLTAAERAAMMGIRTGKRYAGDDRERWSF